MTMVLQEPLGNSRAIDLPGRHQVRSELSTDEEG